MFKYILTAKNFSNTISILMGNRFIRSKVKHMRSILPSCHFHAKPKTGIGFSTSCRNIKSIDSRIAFLCSRKALIRYFLPQFIYCIFAGQSLQVILCFFWQPIPKFLPFFQRSGMRKESLIHITWCINPIRIHQRAKQKPLNKSHLKTICRPKNSVFTLRIILFLNFLPDTFFKDREFLRSLID